MYADSKKVVGGYACGSSTYTFSHSSATPPKKPACAKNESRQRKSKGVMNKPIQFPILAQIAEDIDDSYWQNLFIEMSRGKFPRNFSIRGTQFTFCKSSKPYCIDIPESHHEAKGKIIGFMKNHWNFISNREHLQNKAIENDLMQQKIAEQDLEVTWTKISRKVQENMINEFILTVVEAFELDNTGKRNLRHTIAMGLLTRKIEKQHIKIKDRQIADIEGLLYFEESNDFAISTSDETAKSMRSTISPQSAADDEDVSRCEEESVFISGWKKFLGDTTCRCEKYRKRNRLIISCSS